LRRVPTVAWLCALVAILNAACWSILTPPFQITDEPDHFAYVQELAENGKLPKLDTHAYSFEEIFALQDLNYFAVRRQPRTTAISTQAQQRHLASDLAASIPRRGREAAGLATSQPPLYYALETIPYALGSGGTILDRLELMRLFSALFAGVTALFVFLFLRETLPGAPFAWAVGGFGAAFSPLLASTSSGVNPDALLFAVCAAAFYLLARAFRRRLTPRLALTIGAVIAIGFFAKLTFIGLAPGVILGLILLSIREARSTGLAAYRSLAAACTLAASPAILYLIVNIASGKPVLGIVSDAIHLTHHHGTVPGEMSYIWQLYLPRIPGMHNDFPGIFTTREVWFNGLIGLYGWLDTLFSDRVYDLALIPAALILGLCVRALVIGRTMLRGRLAELAVYLTMTIGLLLLIGAASYLRFPAMATDYRQPRYILPLLALYSFILALAVRGAGKRWGPAAGTLIVVLLFAHDIFSQLLVISRYYG
jgi:4-amino-4-deoxy-L-arabinose transferase-like glycosyltransferase